MFKIFQKRQLAAQSLTFNVSNKTFCELFPDVAEVVFSFHVTVCAYCPFYCLCLILSHLPGTTANMVKVVRHRISYGKWVMVALCPDQEGSLKNMELRCFFSRLHLHHHEDSNEPCTVSQRKWGFQWRSVTRFWSAVVHMTQTANYESLEHPSPPPCWTVSTLLSVVDNDG